MKQPFNVKKIVKNKCSDLEFKGNVTKDSIEFLKEQLELFIGNVVTYSLISVKSENRKTILIRDIKVVLDSRTLAPKLIPTGNKVSGSGEGIK